VLYDDDTGYLDSCGEPSGYSLDIFPGVGVGPINEIANFYGLYEGWAMTSVTFKNNSVLPYFKGSSGLKTMPFSEDIMYYGGPYFIIDETSSSYANISDYQEIATYDYNGEPAIISFQYGDGKVVLSGPHPEIEEDSRRDRQNLTDYPYSPRKYQLNDNGSDWELVSHLFDWIMDKERPVSFVMTPPQNLNVVQGESIGPIVQVITNHSESVSTVYLNSFLRRPTGRQIRLNARDIVIDPGATTIIPIEVRILEQAPAGFYTFTVRVTGETGTLLDQDFLYFQVGP